MAMLKNPVHPGEILKHEFLKEMGISAGKLAKHIHVPRTRTRTRTRTRIERLCEERTSVTPDTAKRLSKALGTTPEFWLNLQTHYDLLADQAADIEEIKPLLAA